MIWIRLTRHVEYWAKFSKCVKKINPLPQIWAHGNLAYRAKLETYPRPSPKIDFKKGSENKEKDD